MAKNAINPSHYKGDAVMVFIEEFKLGFCLGNTVKYVARAGKKNRSKIVEDLKKARWYLEREITKLEKAAIERAARNSKDTKGTPKGT